MVNMGFETLTKDWRLDGSDFGLPRPGWDQATSWGLYHLVCGIESGLCQDSGGLRPGGYSGAGYTVTGGPSSSSPWEIIAVEVNYKLCTQTHSTSSPGTYLSCSLSHVSSIAPVSPATRLLKINVGFLL